MKAEYIENCMAGWVAEHKRLTNWITETENVLASHKHLSDFGVQLYQRMIDEAKINRAKCRRKIRWLGQMHDKAVGQHKFTAPEYSIDKNTIKQRIDLVEFIGRHTELKNYGRRYRGLCPMPDHPEKTPSFYVESSKGWYCHGCHRGGDLFAFVQAVEGVDFLTAVKKLGGNV